MYYACFHPNLANDADSVQGRFLVPHLREMRENADRLQKWCQQLDKQVFDQGKIIVELTNRIAFLEKKAQGGKC